MEDKQSVEEKAEIILILPIMGLYITGIVGLLVALMALISREYLGAGVAVIGASLAFGCYVGLFINRQKRKDS